MDEAPFSSGTTVLKQSEIIQARAIAGERILDSDSSEGAGVDVQKLPVSGEEDSDKQGKDGSPATGKLSGSLTGMPESSAGPVPVESHGEESDLMPWSQTVSQASLADTILAAAKSLTSHEDTMETQDKTMVSTPVDVESPAPRNPELSDDGPSIKIIEDGIHERIILPPSPKPNHRGENSGTSRGDP